MSITFSSIQEAKEYRRQKEQEGYTVQLNNYKGKVIAYLISKRKKKEYIYPNKSIHLTQKDLGERTELKTSSDYIPKGVSFAPTVRQALEGVPDYYTNTKDWERRRKFVEEEDEWNVYTPIRKRTAITPESISDYKRTGERRVLSNVIVKRIGKIKVKVGNNKWEYHWIEKSSEV